MASGLLAGCMTLDTLDETYDRKPTMSHDLAAAMPGLHLHVEMVPVYGGKEGALPPFYVQSQDEAGGVTGRYQDYPAAFRIEDEQLEIINPLLGAVDLAEPFSVEIGTRSRIEDGVAVVEQVGLPTTQVEWVLGEDEKEFIYRALEANPYIHPASLYRMTTGTGVPGQEGYEPPRIEYTQPGHPVKILPTLDVVARISYWRTAGTSEGPAAASPDAVTTAPLADGQRANIAIELYLADGRDDRTQEDRENGVPPPLFEAPYTLGFKLTNLAVYSEYERRMKAIYHHRLEDGSLLCDGASGVDVDGNPVIVSEPDGVLRSESEAHCVDQVLDFPVETLAEIEVLRSALLASCYIEDDPEKSFFALLEEAFAIGCGEVMYSYFGNTSPIPVLESDLILSQKLECEIETDMRWCWHEDQSDRDQIPDVQGVIDLAGAILGSDN